MALKTFTSLEYYINLSVEASDSEIPDTNVTVRHLTGFELAVCLRAVRRAMPSSSLVSRDISQRLNPLHANSLSFCEKTISHTASFKKCQIAEAEHGISRSSQ